MTSRRQRQMAARKLPITSQQDLTRKKIFQNIDEQTKHTENIIARLRARLDVLDLVVDKSLPEDVFLARKEMNHWIFRRNERLNNKWDFVNNMVTMQEFLVAASEARKRQDEARAISLHSNLQHTLRTSSSEAVTNAPSMSRMLNQEAGEEDYSKNAGYPSQTPPKEAIAVRHIFKINQQTEQETPSVSDIVLKSDTSLSIGASESVSAKIETCPSEEISEVCGRSEGNGAVLPAAIIDDSKAEIDAKTKIIPETSDKDKLSSKTTPLLNGSNSSNVEFFKLDIHLNSSKQQFNLRPSLKPVVSFSKFRAMAQDLEKTLTFDWVPEAGAEICQYCSKSVCVGQRFKVYLAGKEKMDIRPLQAQPSERMKSRIADVAAIYGLGYR